ncbi:phosphoethanolamine transferase [Campylobacterota bacterium]|nr:phosphoethanolamine transferase [Campylobacterota bacterium]
MFRLKKIKSSTAIVIVAIYFATIPNIVFWKYVFDRITIGGFSDIVFVVSVPFFMFAPMLIIASLLMIPYAGKAIVSILMIISAYASHAMFTYGIYIDADMVQNVFETNTREALDLITFSLAIWVVLLGVIPSILLFIIKIKYGSIAREITMRLIMFAAALAIIGVIAAISYKEYASFGRNNGIINRLITPTNYIYGTARYFYKLSLANRQFIRIGEDAKYVGSDQPIVFVYVVGETARAQNFSLGSYDRQTNPNLARESEVIYFDNVASCGTATAISLPCMFSRYDRKSFNQTDAQFSENMLDVAQRAGYNIVWKENDDGCKGVCERVENMEMIEAPNAEKYCDNRYCYDEILLDGLDEYVKAIKQNTIIVLHTIGSHGPTYYKRYPDRFKIFTPTCDTAQIEKCSREQIVNTYDNTILYTDFIVAETIAVLKRYENLRSSLIYVSDHGESLGENGVYLHGLPYMIAPEYQTRVPMILWLSENADNNKSHANSSRNLGALSFCSPAHF